LGNNIHYSYRRGQIARACELETGDGLNFVLYGLDRKIMYKLYFFAFFLFTVPGAFSQLVEVHASYTGAGDVEFVAYNNSSVPLFLKLDFADLENTVFREPLPYIKMLDPGFNTLFTLFREPDAESPRFNYQIRSFRSNPMALPDLDFPYLIPLAEGREAEVFDVKRLDGFYGPGEPSSWQATGFEVQAGEPVFASRTGIIVEVTGTQRTGDPHTWYHNWNNSITVLQPDGTLISYCNVDNKDHTLQPGMKIFAGQSLGHVIPGAGGLILLMFQEGLESEELRFIIPQYVTGEGEAGILLPSQKYEVIHPEAIIGLEMTNREKRRHLK
jgi:hypothetical protein